MKAEIITIGDEILLGQVVDSNSAWIGHQLDLQNIAVCQITSISDEPECILSSLALASSRADIIIVTGGLGPTKDDVTKETISSYFNSPLVCDTQVLLHVKELFERMNPGKPMPATNTSQADVLACADVLFNDVGTAPGMYITFKGVVYVFLPGVPFEMKFLMEKHVLPRLNTLSSSIKVYHSHIITVGLGESFLAEQIADIEERLPPFIKLAYLPKLALVRLRLTAKGQDYEEIKRITESFASEIADRLIEHVVIKEDITLEEALVRLFTQSGKKLAIAESCSGGGLASAITLVPGASRMFECGIVAYANSIKTSILGVSEQTLMDHGAVSEETVIQMASGIKRISNADYAIATSGVAGPGGGTPDKPVGTVWIAVCNHHQTVTRKFTFRNDRTINIERTIAHGLAMVWKLFKTELGDI